MNDDIRFMLECAIRAPSGDNNQPWHFVLTPGIIDVYEVPESDPSLYDFMSRASYIALGAAIENLCLAAEARQYRVNVSYFPESGKERHVASITLAKEHALEADPLWKAIGIRASNRKPYKRNSISRNDIEELQRAAPFLKLHITTDPKEIGLLACAASIHDELIFSNKTIHHLFFSQITWTKQEEERRRTGIYVPQLERAWYAYPLLWILRHWVFARIGSILGLHKIIAFINRKTYRSSGAYGIVTIDTEVPLDWIRAGRSIERLWLAATSRGISFQPMTGTLFLKEGLETAGIHTRINATSLWANKYQAQKVTDVYRKIQHIMGAEKPLAFMFRMGRGDPPSSLTIRLPLTKSITVQQPE